MPTKKKTSKNSRVRKNVSGGKSPAPKKVTWKLHDPDEAQDKILRATNAVKDAQEVTLVDAVDRVLAQDVKSPLTLPAVDCSERDGYAIRSADLTKPKLPRELTQKGDATAGQQFSGSLKTGECVRIATGAVIPKGADAVVMFEDVAQGKKGGILFKEPVKAWQWVSRAGSDLKRGRVMLRKGDALTPAKIACASSCGLKTLPVLRPP